MVLGVHPLTTASRTGQLLTEGYQRPPAPPAAGSAAAAISKFGIVYHACSAENNAITSHISAVWGCV